MGDKIKCLGEYCFHGKDITEVQIPEGIETIPADAFYECSKLTHVVLPSTLKYLNATCFASTALKEIVLPDGLDTIATWVFAKCPMEEVTIPASVGTISNGAFREISNLKTVTFSTRLNSDGTVSIPDIKAAVFEYSGSEAADTTIYVPWKKGQTPLAPWGASYAKVVYADGEITYKAGKEISNV
jgi:hypothetical protein